eukprot:TRINITY_DN285_c0_g1_i16.p1 TRINITY_DN285_c0_g1~~TRINITY_DN285_c0_g1_i16.p1  ORF type:complete len:416 (-),score=63.61 TRINITY_DN285_c0_g1_i16:1730-2977(-)
MVTGWRIAAAAAAAFLCLCTVACAQGQDHFTVLFTSSLRGNLEGLSRGRGGLARIECLKNNYSNVLLLDSGDFIYGGPAISTLLQGESTVDIYNRMGYSAVSFGNLDFSATLTDVQRRVVQANFTWLGANMVLNETTWEQPWWVKPYVVLRVSNVSVCVIGLDTPATPITGHNNTLNGLSASVVCAPTHKQEPRSATQLKQCCTTCSAITILAQIPFDNQTIIGVTYEGLNTLVDNLNAANKPVLLAIGADAGKFYRRGPTVIASAGQDGVFLGQIDVSVQNGVPTVSTNTSHILVVNSTTCGEDPAIKNRIGNWSMIVEPLTERVIATTEGSILKGTRNEESKLGNMVADSMLWRIKQVQPNVSMVLLDNVLLADVPCASPPCEITWQDTFDILPFQNKLVTMTLNGSQVRQSC